MSDSALTVYIEAVAAALAADLIDAADVHDLSDDDLALAQALAEKRHDNLFAIHPMAKGEALSLQLQNAAYVIGIGLTTSARLRDRCLAGRDDADDLMAIIEMRAAKIAAPAPPRPEPRQQPLSHDGGEVRQPGVDPSLYFPLGRSERPPTASERAARCVEGLHEYVRFKNPAIPRTTHHCAHCGLTIRLEPPGPIYFEGGNYFGPRPF